VIPLLRDRLRIVTTSLLGYGGTKERRTTTDTAIDREAEIVEAVVRHAGDAAQLVGHSFEVRSVLPSLFAGSHPF